MTFRITIRKDQIPLVMKCFSDNETPSRHKVAGNKDLAELMFFGEEGDWLDIIECAQEHPELTAYGVFEGEADTLGGDFAVMGGCYNDLGMYDGDRFIELELDKDGQLCTDHKRLNNINEALRFFKAVREKLGLKEPKPKPRSATWAPIEPLAK
jgi:hypothetical protein